MHAWGGQLGVRAAAPPCTSCAIIVLRTALTHTHSHCTATHAHILTRGTLTYTP